MKVKKNSDIQKVKEKMKKDLSDGEDLPKNKIKKVMKSYLSS